MAAGGCYTRLFRRLRVHKPRQRNVHRCAHSLEKGVDEGVRHVEFEYCLMNDLIITRNLTEI